MQNLEGQPASNFRDKEGFILVYEMCSEIHNRRLEKWIDRILVEATNPHCIIMVLGNNNYGVLPAKNERINSLR